MTYGPITVVRPGATATIGVRGATGKEGEPGTDGDPGATGPAPFGKAQPWGSGQTYLVGPPAAYVVPPAGDPFEGGSFVCVVNHTSGTFSTDYANGLWYAVALRGTQGKQGVAGSTWYSGVGAPAATVGIDGDYFFRTDTSDIYLRVSGAWTQVANIKGTAGSNGNTIRNGTGAPPQSVGTNGDFYLDATPSAPTLYGPKAGGAWPSSGISLVGPSGNGSGSVNTSGGTTLGHFAVFGANGTVIRDGGAPGDAAFKNTGVLSGQLAAADDARITGALQASQALAEIAATGPATQAWARQNLDTLSHGQIVARVLLG